MRNKIVLLTLLPLVLNTGCATTVNNSIDSYDKLLVSCRDEDDFHTELYVFPDSSSIGTATSFSYKTTPDLLTGSFLLYLVMSYDQETFDAELSRLDKIEGLFPYGESKKIIHYEEESVYLTICRDNRFEYAMYFKDELKIAYVSNQLYSWFETGVSTKYRLPDLTIPSDLDDGDNSYNMYYFYRDEPDGMGGTIHTGMYVVDNQFLKRKNTYY